MPPIEWTRQERSVFFPRSKAPAPPVMVGRRPRNLKKCGSSMYKYVAKTPTGSFACRIRYEGKGIWLGTFADEIEAAKAVDVKLRELFGADYAGCNFPSVNP